MITRKEGWQLVSATFAALFGITARGWKLWLEQGGWNGDAGGLVFLHHHQTLFFSICILRRSAIGWRATCVYYVVVRKQRVRGTETPVVYQPLQCKHKQWPQQYFAEFLCYTSIYVKYVLYPGIIVKHISVAPYLQLDFSWKVWIQHLHLLMSSVQFLPLLYIMSKCCENVINFPPLFTGNLSTCFW